MYGSDLAEIDRLAKQIEAVIRTVPGTTSAFAERVLGGYYVNIDPDRAAVDRYGLTIKDVLEVVQTALGGEMVTTTVEGRERFSVNVRYPRGLRDDPQAIASQVLVNGSDGTAIPLGQIASISIAQGAPSIRTENAQLVDYIYVDLQGRDLGGYVADAQKAVHDQVKLPAGYHVEWSGQFEYLQRAKAKLQTVVPLTLFLIFILLYLNFQRLTETLIVMLSVPFALTGGLWLMYLLGFNMSVAVAVGFIALAGVAAETGVVMLIYLDHAFTAMVEERQKGRALAHRTRPLRGHHRRRGRAGAAKDDDGLRDHGRPVADPVEHRHGLRGDAPHRRADGRRHGLLHGTHPARHSGDLCDRQGMAVDPPGPITAAQQGDRAERGQVTEARALPRLCSGGQSHQRRITC